jgi:hypothetical protein
VAEIVAVLVGVAAPVGVAVHLNGNATVGVLGRQERRSAQSVPQNIARAQDE